MNNLEKLKQELKNLENKINELENKENNNYKRERLEREENFWYLDEFGEVEETYESYSKEDNFLFKIGNYFETEEQAKKYKEKLLIEQELRDIAMELNKGEKIDWSESRQSKYGLYFDYSSNGIFQLISVVSKHQGTIYCLDSDFKEIAKDRIGEERLTEYLKGELD